MNTKLLLTILVVLFTVVGLAMVNATAKTYYAAPLQPVEPSYYTPVEVDTPAPIIEEIQPIKGALLGEFTVTHYDACKACCGKTDGITFSGAHVADGVTVAVDPEVIPLGTYLYIEGIGFRVAQDTGGKIKGNKIDVYVPSHKEALERGVLQAKVYIIQEGNNEDQSQN